MKKLFLILLFLFLFAGYADAANMAYFNGSNSYINATANVDSGIYPMWDDYKFEFSIKLSPGTSSQNIFQWSDLSTGFIISVGTDGLLYVTHNDTDWHSVSRVDDNDLHSIIVQRVSSAFSIIIDTEEDATGTDSYDISTGTGNANTFIGGTYLYGLMVILVILNIQEQAQMYVLIYT
jgi:hypothetical protein